MKEVKFATAIVLNHPTDTGKILVVRRPSHAESLPNVWGLPAVMMQGEPVDLATERVGREKLATTIKLIQKLGSKEGDRKSHILNLTLVETKLADGAPLPSVTQAPTLNLKYDGQLWTPKLETLREAAEAGSLCAQILLELNNINY